jgi:hypothetical protein
MIEEAIRTVEDMSKPITVPGAFAPVELPKPAPVHRKDLAKTLHALFDKIQLQRAARPRTLRPSERMK